MKARRIRVVSPAEPSGASWLLNCLLELGIKVNHKPVVDNIWRASRPRPGASHMWISDGSRLILNPKADLLRKWLPALSGAESFAFRDDVEVEYVQDFPALQPDGAQTLFFIRDPRDALYSMYRRIDPDVEFEEFLRFPNPQTLLDAVDHWCLFVMCWRAHADIRFFRFEDYKIDARRVLAEVMSVLQLDSEPAAIDRAVFESSFDKASSAEARYRGTHTGDTQIANRAGRVGDWRDRSDIATGIRAIEQRACGLLRKFGYPCTQGPAIDEWRPADGGLAPLQFFQTIGLPSDLSRRGPKRSGAPVRPLDAVSFAERVDAALLQRSHLAPDDIRALLDSLLEILGANQPSTAQRIRDVRSSFEDGTVNFFERVKELRSQRRALPQA